MIEIQLRVERNQLVEKNTIDYKKEKILDAYYIVFIETK